MLERASGDDDVIEVIQRDTGRGDEVGHGLDRYARLNALEIQAKRLHKVSRLDAGCRGLRHADIMPQIAWQSVSHFLKQEWPISLSSDVYSLGGRAPHDGAVRAYSTLASRRWGIRPVLSQRI